jgi:hypothetical protein
MIDSSKWLHIRYVAAEGFTGWCTTKLFLYLTVPPTRLISIFTQKREFDDEHALYALAFFNQAQFRSV